MVRLPSQHRLALLLLAIAAYFPLFLHLDGFPIAMWDESRFALNALEMTQNGNPLVTYYEGEPDFWNSKPPLAAALEALSMKILGYTELAVRLPSALAAVFTLLVLLGFSCRVLDNIQVGYLAVLTLICSAGYIKLHVVRTGDTDSLLVLFITLYALSWFAYLEQEQKKWLFLLGAAMVLGIYTKGIAALLPVPGLLLYTAISGKLRFALTRPGLYLTALAVLLAGAAYYLLREQLTPGYVESVAMNEWGGRFLRETSQQEAVNLDFGFYWRSLWRIPNHPFLWLLPLLAVLGLFSRNGILKRLTLLCLSLSLSLLLLLSWSHTKHYWYDAPIYPFLALMSGTGLWEAYKRSKTRLKAPYRQGLAVLLSLMLFAPAYLKVLQRVTNRDQITHWEAEGAMMQQVQRQFPQIKHYTVLKNVQHPFHYGQIYFYRKAYALRFGTEISVGDEATASPGEILLCCQKPLLDSLQQRYHPVVLSAWRQCRLLQVPDSL